MFFKEVSYARQGCLHLIEMYEGTILDSVPVKCLETLKGFNVFGTSAHKGFNQTYRKKQ